MAFTLPDGRRLGAHLPVAHGMVAAVERASEIGAQALQIFADNPSAWRRRTDPPPELADYRDCLQVRDIGPVAVHAAYLVNLAGPEDAFYQRSIELLTHELTVAPSFGARYVNVHTGSHKLAGLETGLERIGDGVTRVLAAVEAGPGSAFLVLENSVGSGGGIGSNPVELEQILESIAAHGADLARIRLCLDTAHMWGAGISIAQPDELDSLLDEIETRIGLDRLAMIHLNDSKSELGSKLDRHEHLGAGRIGALGLRHLLIHPRLAHVTYYLETPGMDEGYDAVNVARAYAIAAGEPLQTLPPEAMNLRGGRARSTPARTEA
jgi:deoxyribonuclease-4